MAFQFDQSAFPLLTPQQTSPLGGVLSDAIAKRLSMAKTQEEEEKAPYAGVGALSKALSESAYAGAVTPQFQSKLLENIMTASNIPDPEKRRLLAQILQYGGAQGGGAGASSNPAINKMQQLINQKLEHLSQRPRSLGDTIKGWLGGNQGAPAVPVEQSQGQGIPAQAQVAPSGPAVQPSSAQAPSGGQAQGGDWFGNIGASKGTIAQGEKEGAARGEAVAQYGKDAKAVIGQQRASKQILSLLHDPDIRAMTQIPFFNKTVQSAYEQAGNKNIQEKLGKLDTAILNYIAASPQKTDADKDFLLSQKPNKSDPLHVKLGKLAQLEIFNESAAEQIKLANKYVKQGYDQTTAELMASQDVDVEKIEKKINREVFGNQAERKSPGKSNLNNADITVENLRHTAQQTGLSVPEVIKRLKKKGYTIKEGPINAS